MAILRLPALGLLVLALACVALLAHSGFSRTELAAGGDSSVPGSRLLAEALRDEAPHLKDSRKAKEDMERRRNAAEAEHVAHKGIDAVGNSATDQMAQKAADEVTKLEKQAMDSIETVSTQPVQTVQAPVAPVVHAPKESKVQREADEEVRKEKQARRVVLELAREHLSENFDKLRLARDKRKHDGMVAQYEPFLRGKFGKLMKKKSALISREQLDITAAKALEARARRLSQQVVKNLNVHNGKFSLAEWYRNGGALESSKDSTEAVAGAKRMWARVVTDQRALKRIEASPLFNKHATQLAAAEIVLQNGITKLGDDAARISADGVRVARLAAQRRQLSPFLAAPAKPVLHTAAPHNAGTAVANAAGAVAEVALPFHAVMTAAGVASGGGAQSKGVADSVRLLASSIARAVGLGGIAGRAAAAVPAGPEKAAAHTAPTAAAQAAVKGAVQGAVKAAVQGATQRAAQQGGGPRAAGAGVAGGKRGRAGLRVDSAEGGRPAREQELASMPSKMYRAPAHIKGHGKVFHESRSERVADLVYLAADQETRRSVPRAQLPKIERDNIFNW